MVLKQRIVDGISISGLGQILDGKSSAFRRTLWILVLIATTIWLAGNTIGRLMIFLSHPSTVIVNTTFEPETQFPSVTICYKNGFSLLTSYGITRAHGYPFRETVNYTVTDFITAFSPYIYGRYIQNGSNQDVDVLEKDFPAIFISRDPFFKMIERLTIDPMTMIRECLIKGEQCPSTSMSTKVTDAGHCFVFNKDGKVKIFGSGSKSGLHLKISIAVDELLPVNSEVGPIVMVHSPGTQGSNVGEQGSNLPLSFATTMAFSETLYEVLGEPYNNCSMDTELEKCLRDCGARDVLEHCRCLLPWQELDTSKDENGRNCTMRQQLTCTIPRSFWFNSSPEKQMDCECKQKCKRVRYSIETSYGTLQENTLYENAPPAENIRQKQAIKDYLFLRTMNEDYSNQITEMAEMMKDVTDFVYQKLINDTGNDIKATVVAVRANEYLTALDDLNSNITRSPLFEGFDLLYRNKLPLPLDDFNARVVFSYLRQRMWELDELLGGMDEKLKNIHDILSGIIRDPTATMNEAFKQRLQVTLNNLTVEQERLGNLAQIHANLTREFKSNHALQNPTPFQVNTDITNRIERGRKGYAEFNLYRSSPDRVMIVQQASDSVNSLLCDIGGTLGLCLGGSVLTLVEIFDVIYLHFTNSKAKEEKKAAGDKPNANSDSKPTLPS